MRLKSSIVILLLCITSLFAQTEDDLQKAMQNLVILMEKSAATLKEITESNQKAIGVEKKSWMLFYKDIKNSAKVEKRNDLLTKTQIEYRFIKDKDIPNSTILVVVRDGIVELFGKVPGKKTALQAIDTALHTKGVKEVISYLVIIEPKKIAL